MPVRGYPSPSLWPLVGRAEEIMFFTDELKNRHCHGFVVTGAAGVGKSRLARECLSIARQHDFHVGTATANGAASAVPLGAIAHLLPHGVDLGDPVTGFAQVASVFARRGNGRRVFLVEDLHLLDATSAVLLRQLMDAGVIKLITTLRAGVPIGETVRALAEGDGIHRIALEEFDLRDTGELLQSVLASPVSSRALAQMHTASQGNALYLKELVQGALESSTLYQEAGVYHLRENGLRATRRLSDIIKARLSSIRADDHAVLELLALCESLSLTDVLSRTSEAHLAELESSGLIRVAQDQRRTAVSLAHPLYGEVLRAEIPVLRRKALLLEAAYRLDSHRMRRREDARLSATWRLAATGTADPQLLLQAARLARHAHDYRQVVLLLRALPTDHEKLDTRLLLGEALFQMGRWIEADEVLASVEDTQAEEPERIAVALARSTNLLWANVPISEALAVNAAAEADAVTAAGRRMLRINEGFIRIANGQPRQGLELLKELEDDFEDVAEVDSWLRGALMKPAALVMIGRTEEAKRLAEKAYQAHVLVDEHALVSHPVVQRSSLLLGLCESGEFARAMRVGESALQDLSHSSTMARIWFLFFMARTQWIVGHPATARRHYAEATALGHSINLSMALHLSLPGMAACAAVLGDHKAAKSALDEVQRLPNSSGFFSPGEKAIGPAWLLASQGRIAEAREHLSVGALVARHSGHATSESMLLTDIARLGGAASVMNRLRELAKPGDGGRLLPARAALAAALAAGDADLLMESSSELGTLGSDVLASEAAAEAAAALRRTGQSRRAAQADTQSAHYAARCEGMRTPLMATAGNPSPLTPREREIALAAAAGSRSRQIAEALHLSVRTVNNHLQHAYAKLGVKTRDELAAALDASASGQSHP
ncbi:LuxR C-terminal-related transcriptional regulator [Streptomyces globisporus]|uniref:LuxR C-terminal-related transcriptional regulator n=1 Tax=Streptomyces globisporus TaxID=1908 RepID=UPI00382529CE